MKARWFVAVLATLASQSVPLARADGPVTGSIAFILDCSQSMGEPAEAEAAVKQASTAEEPSRMDAADRLLRTLLHELATEGNCQVGLWLYGHRLVWEQDAKHPDLLSQDDYLEATVGFDALNGLLPGDDVQQAYPFGRFTTQEYRQMLVRLDTLKPWGEKPLYLALTRSLEALADQPATAPKNVIVLTDGGNEQWLARHKTNHDQVAKALRSNLVPIHFIHFGPLPEEDDPAERELHSLAEQSGGSLVHVHAKTELTVAQILNSSRKVATRSVSAPTDDPNIEDKIAEAKAILARAADRSISGSVVYYGKPVSSATVTLEGTDIPPAKVDKQGRFLIRKVPAGRQYHVVVKAVARNHAREAEFDLKLDADSEQQPFLTIDVK